MYGFYLGFWAGPGNLNLPLIVGVIAVVALALIGLIGYLIDRSADKHERE
jgi:hypothetical protein